VGFAGEAGVELLVFAGGVGVAFGIWAGKVGVDGPTARFGGYLGDGDQDRLVGEALRPPPASVAQGEADDAVQAASSRGLKAFGDG